MAMQFAIINKYLLDLMSSQHEARKEAYSANKEKLAEMESKLLEKREDSALNL